MSLLDQLTFFAEIKKHKIRFLKSCGFYACFFLIGLSVGIIGPTLIDLAIQTGTDLTKTSLILPLRAGGYVVGSFTCTIIYDRVNVLLSCIVTMAVSGLMMLLVPLLHNIWALLSLFFILGFAFGINEASVNIYIIHLWGKEVTPFMQGCLTDAEKISNGTIDFLTTTINSVNSTTRVASSIDDFAPSDLKLIYPYAIIAVYSVVLIIWFTLMYIYVPNTDPHPTRLESSAMDNDDCANELPIDLTTISPRTPSLSFSGSIRKRHDSVASQKYAEKALSRQTSAVNKLTSRHENNDLSKAHRLAEMKVAEKAKTFKWYQVENPTKATIVVLSVIFIHVYYGLELTFGSFLAPFSVSSNIHMNTRDGAQLSSIFWAAFTFWRLFTIFYIGFTGPRLGIIINLCILAVGAIIIVPWGFDHSWALYAGTILIGVGISPLWGSIFGFLEIYFPVTSRIASSMMSAAAVGEFVYPAILARYMDCQSIVFIYLIFFCSALCVIVFSVIVFVCRYKMTETPATNRVTLH